MKIHIILYSTQYSAVVQYSTVQYSTVQRHLEEDGDGDEDWADGGAGAGAELGQHPAPAVVAGEAAAGQHRHPTAEHLRQKYYSKS